MKKILFFIVALISLVPLNTNASTDTIPNGSFESWSFFAWAENPTFWMTSNTDFMIPNVVKDSDAYSGYLGMMLTFFNAIQPQAMCGFPLTSHPVFLEGYVKDHLSIGDSTVAVVRVYYNQQVVDSGYSLFWGGINPNYMPFIVPISQNSAYADSCVIEFTGGMTAFSSITFDDLRLDFSSGIPETNSNKFSVYPNPCIDHVTLKSTSPDLNPIHIYAYDILGRKQEIPFDKNSALDYIVEMNTSAIHPGIWIITITEEKKSYSLLLIKN